MELASADGIGVRGSLRLDSSCSLDICPCSPSTGSGLVSRPDPVDGLSSISSVLPAENADGSGLLLP